MRTIEAAHSGEQKKSSRLNGMSNEGPVVFCFCFSLSLGRELSNSDRIERVGATPAGRPVKCKPKGDLPCFFGNRFQRNYLPT